THAHTRHLMETEAGMSREAWGRAMDASDLSHGESADRRRQRAISDLLEIDRGRREEMRELRATDHTRQQQIIQTLTVICTDTTEGDGSTTGTGHHTAGAHIPFSIKNGLK
ncbi:hypothetical protein Tco_0430390, partial [Tanacetum coccineum]